MMINKYVIKNTLYLSIYHMYMYKPLSLSLHSQNHIDKGCNPPLLEIKPKQDGK